VVLKMLAIISLAYHIRFFFFSCLRWRPVWRIQWASMHT